MNSISHTRDHRLLLVALVCLVFSLLCLRGVAHEPPLHLTAHEPPLHLTAHEPSPRLTAWAALSGDSMLPTFVTPCFIEVILGSPFEDLKPGDIVVFRSGDPLAPIVCHRLVSKRGGGWVTKGDNNAHYDGGWVLPSNFVAVATGKYSRFVIVLP